MDELDMRSFDFATLGKGNVIGVTGSKRTGKSTMLKHIARHLHASVDTALAMSIWYREREQFRTFMSANDVHDYDVERVAAIVAEQSQLMKEKKPLKHVAILIDGAPCGAFKDQTMRQVFYESRHLNITLAFTMESAVDVPPFNIDVVLAFSVQCQQKQRKLFMNFGGVFPTFQAFHKTFRACTTQYQCVVLDNRVKILDSKDGVFHSDTHGEHANEAPFHLGEPASPHPNVEDLVRQLTAVCEALMQVLAPKLKSNSHK